MHVKGMPNATGLVSRSGHVAEEDADVVVNLRNAGAILTCLTNTSEVRILFLNFFSRIYNPFNPVA